MEIIELSVTTITVPVTPVRKGYGKCGGKPTHKSEAGLIAG